MSEFPDNNTQNSMIEKLTSVPEKFATYAVMIIDTNIKTKKISNFLRCIYVESETLTSSSKN